MCELDILHDSLYGTVAKLAMGHTSVATTARYDFRAESSREKVCKNLEVFG